MECRHQVFVSSTYTDLIPERQHVMHALLELDCIPSGMEMLPAADEDAWALITGVIDDSDYYVLILAGRYGQTDASGLSYTEREYDYAVAKGKPVMAFLHEAPTTISSGQCEQTDEGKERLEAFRTKVKARHCKFWKNADDLGAKVSRGLVMMRKKHPSPGWVPGKYAADEAMLRKMEQLRSRIAELEAMVASPATAAPPSAAGLEHGTDTVSHWGKLRTKAGSSETSQIVLTTTWDKILKYLGPSLAGECDEKILEEKLRLAFWHAVPKDIGAFNEYSNIIIPHVLFDAVKVQLQALGLMIPGTKRRAVSDQSKYWKLSPYGEQYLLRLQARRRKEKVDSAESTPPAVAAVSSE